MKELEARLEQQVRVSKILGLGFVFSIAPFVVLRVLLLAGLVSLLSLLTGLKAMKMIRRAEEEVDGMEMAKWCIIVGAMGTVIYPLLFLLSRKSQQLW